MTHRLRYVLATFVSVCQLADSGSTGPQLGLHASHVLFVWRCIVYGCSRARLACLSFCHRCTSHPMKPVHLWMFNLCFLTRLLCWCSIRRRHLCVADSTGALRSNGNRSRAAKFANLQQTLSAHQLWPVNYKLCVASVPFFKMALNS